MTPETENMPEPKPTHEMPRVGQVMILCGERGGERLYRLGHVSSIDITASFDKQGKPVKVLKWMAYIVFRVHQYTSISFGDTIDPGGWHAPTEEEMKWPGVAEAVAASKPAETAVAVAPVETAAVPAPRRGAAGPASSSVQA